MSAVRIMLGVIVGLGIVWLTFLVVLVVVRPKGSTVADAARFVPDIVRLVRDLAKDPTLPRSIRRRLSFLLGYLALPIDIVPDFIPVLGYADDVIVTALVLRSVVRRAGPRALEKHWRGSPQGLALLHRLCGIT